MKFFSTLSLSFATIFSLLSIQNAVAQAIPTCAQRGEGAALLEGECVSIFGGYQRQNFDRSINSFASDSDQFNVGIQGQKEIADEWYVSIGAGYADFNAPRSIFGLEREVESFSFGAALKYVQKDLLLSATFSAAHNDVSQTTLAAFANTPGQGVLFTNDETNYSAVLALRAATLIDDGNGYYAKPSVDVGLIYTHTKNSDTFFRTPVTVLGDIETSNHVFAFVTPALEVGLDLEYDTFSIRPFAFGGARFLFNEDETRNINSSFVGITLTDDELSFERNSTSAFLGAGATLFASGGLSSRITYAATFQSRLVSHNVSAQLQIDF